MPNFSNFLLQPKEVDMLLYHGDCVDGFTSAFICYFFMKTQNKKKKVKFIPCQYQKAPPNVSGRNVLICDFSLKFEVTRSNKKILLSKKEFALLEFLLKHKNSIKSKEEIIQSIWNYDDDILPNTVEVYINYLREKIDKPFKKSKKLITTVRGFGYKISDE